MSDAVPAAVLEGRPPAKTEPTEPDHRLARLRLSSVVSRLAAANLAMAAVTVLTAPLQARVLGPAGRGELAAILVPLGLAPVILSIGLGTYGFRNAALGARVGTLVGTLGSLLFLLGVLGAALGPLVGEFVANGRPVVETWVIVGFALPIGLLNIFWRTSPAALERWERSSRYVSPCRRLLVGIWQPLRGGS
jgi:O-antigen/teichoic acid export membrane protein